MDEQLVRDCLRMLRNRESYYLNSFQNGKSFNLDVDCAVYGAYSSAVAMLEYAIKGDKETLSQFDYYKERN